MLGFWNVKSQNSHFMANFVEFKSVMSLWMIKYLELELQNAPRGNERARNMNKQMLKVEYGIKVTFQS